MNNKIIKSTPFGSVCIVWSGSKDRPLIVNILLSRPGILQKIGQPKRFRICDYLHARKLTEQLLPFRLIWKEKILNFL